MMKLDRTDKLFLTVWAIAVIAVSYGFFRLYAEHKDLENRYDLFRSYKILSQTEVQDSIRSLEIEIKKHQLEIEKDSILINQLRDNLYMEDSIPRTKPVLKNQSSRNRIPGHIPW